MALGYAGENHHTHFNGSLTDFDDFLSSEVGKLVGGFLGQFAAAPHAEFVADELFGLVGIEVSHEDERHVVGHIVGVEEFLHLAGLRVFEVLGKTDDRAAVGMVAVRFGENIPGKFLCNLVIATVLLLVDGFEFTLEEAEDGVAETLYIDIHPVGELVGGEGVVVDCVVVGSAGVETCATHVLEDGVDLVGDGILRGGDAEPVDFELYVVTFFIVFGGLQTVVSLADAVEVGLFLCPIGGADAVGAFEHDMLEVVGNAGGVGVFVLAAGMDYYAAVDFGLAVFFAKDDFKAVVETEGLDGQVVLCRDSEDGK